jgi:uncharacterized protein with NRDE domain
MCLALFALHTHPRFPLIIAANRDEFYERPTAAAGFWGESPWILAGRDLKEGGTWLGVTRSGRFAAVTNYRDPREFGENRRSRGLLVRGYLESTEPPIDYLAHVGREAGAYNSFNLVVGTPREAAYFSNRGGAARPLGPGVYGLSNHLLDTPWPKVERLKAALFDMLSQDKPGLVQGLFRILADGYRPADDELPHTGVGLEWERLLSSAFIKSENYGTRSSTVFLVNDEGQAHFIERRFGANGTHDGADEFEFTLGALGH